ncbi:MAG: RNA polymerase sigma factor RpoD/SigA [candidate division WOR-3 bacterium]
MREKEIILSKFLNLMEEEIPLNELIERIETFEDEPNEETFTSKKEKKASLTSDSEPFKLYLKEIEKLSLLTEEEELELKEKLEKACVMLTQHLSRVIPVINEFLSFEKKIKRKPSFIKQFLYLDKNRIKKHKLDKERKNLLRLMKNIGRYKIKLEKYKEAYLRTQKNIYKFKYKRYEDAIIKQILKIRIQPVYLKKFINLEKEIYNKFENLILQNKKIEEDLKIELSQEEREKIIHKKEELKNELEKFQFEILASWEEVSNTRKNIEKWENFFSYIKKRLIEGNLRLAFSIAKKYKRLSLSFMDLIQAANTGLVKAADRFDYKKGYKFSTYCIWWIRQSIIKTIAEQLESFSLPIHALTLLNKIKNSKKKFLKKSGILPSIEEISEDIGVSGEKIKFAENLKGATKSLDDPIMEDGKLLFGDTISEESVPSPEKKALLKLLSENLLEELKILSPRERKVLELRYGLLDGESKTLERIASMFNISRERVRQIEENALRKLRMGPNRKKLKTFFHMWAEEL